ncbi:MAG TPA: reverse transcriptase domain-containing protein [Saprospiraceae bacterium]|nr:reverse transcriptase domain-containing protein [Saprospiraceae bacterium]
MEENKKKDWFKLKRYPHIGLPLKKSDRYLWIEKYIKDPEKIANHSFLPFIHRTARVKKFRKEYSKREGVLNEFTQNDKVVYRKSSEKKRELFYASHLDSLVYNYYAKILSEAYEDKIRQSEINIEKVVNAYRSIPVDPSNENSSNKCNIDFANDVINFILEYPDDEFAVIDFDISSFFDNLNHAHLRKTWAEVLNTSRLTPAHFNVFKNITRFSHVDIVDIFEEFKNKIYTQKINKFGKPLEVKQKEVKKICFLRNQNAIAFCTKKEFIKIKQKLLQPSKTKKMPNDQVVERNFGIPQGSPISSVLSNIYLLHFDQSINNFISRHGGIYRRYSDDMVIVCPLIHKEEISDLIYKEITKYNLTVQPNKTHTFIFKRENCKLICGQEFDEKINWNKNFIYLGFEFDGETVLLKSASLSGYYRKMKRYITRAKHFANNKQNKNKGTLFKRRILRKYSYKGAKRTRKYLWDQSKKMFVRSEYYNWGNFLSYAKKAAKIMVNNKIENQIKRHWNILNKLLK